MHRKLDDYRRARVAEYLVVCVAEKELYWFDFRSVAQNSHRTVGAQHLQTVDGIVHDSGEYVPGKQRNGDFFLTILPTMNVPHRR